MTIFNYAQSLCRAAFYDEAIQYYESALRYEPGRVQHLQAYIFNYILLGRWDLAYKNFVRYVKLKGENQSSIGALVQPLMEFLDKNQVPPEAVAGIKAATTEFLLSKGLKPTVDMDFSGLHTGEFIYWKIPVRADSKVVNQLNDELADHLAEKFEDLYCDKFVIAFKAV